MPDRYWSAGGGGDWGNTASWGGTVPVSGDTTIFPEGVSQTVNAGLDQGGVDLEAIITHEGYTGDIGATGGPLLIAANLIEHNGGGGLFVESDLGGAALKIDEIRLLCSNPAAIVEIGSNPADAGDIVKVIALSGHVTIKANAKLDAASRLEIGEHGGGISDVRLVLLDFTVAGTEDLATLRMKSGRVTIDRQLADAVVAGGELTIDTNPVAVVEQFGGTFMYDHRAVDGDGTIIRGFGGTLDLRHTGDRKVVSRMESHVGYIIQRIKELQTFTKHVDYRLQQ